MSLTPSADRVNNAMAWARKAVDYADMAAADAAKAGIPQEAAECASCAAVGLFNLGQLKEVRRSSIRLGIFGS